MQKFLRGCAVVMLLFPSLAIAQARLVKVVVPYAPGGNIDVIARLYAQKAAELLKENWIVENLSGGSGTIGTHFAPIARVAEAPLLFIVNPAQIRARNLAELAADIKRNPKRFSFAISGLG